MDLQRSASVCHDAFRQNPVILSIIWDWQWICWITFILIGSLPAIITTKVCIFGCGNMHMSMVLSSHIRPEKIQLTPRSGSGYALSEPWHLRFVGKGSCHLDISGRLFRSTSRNNRGWVCVKCTFWRENNPPFNRRLYHPGYNMDRSQEL